MADIEEEIIFILTRTNSIKDGIRTETHKDNAMTRQEAIRKMCDAYFKAKDKGVMESERVVAALNALLEGGK